MHNTTTGSPASMLPRSEVRLTGRVVPQEALTAEQRDGMYALLSRYFAGVTREGFTQDLAEKHWAILLEDVDTGRIQGFSTLMQMRLTVDAQPVIAFFSGDTIVARENWGESELPRLFIRHIMSVTAGETEARIYWFLISSGYKTYRFLPVFFRAFYPHYERPTPARERQLMDRLAIAKFGPEYDPGAGVVRFTRATPLQDGVAEVTERRLRDPHVAFFVQANPGHADGDELVCLCELTETNLTPAGRRMLGIGPGGAP